MHFAPDAEGSLMAVEETSSVIEDLMAVEAARLPDLVGMREDGTDRGRCYVCSHETEHGWAEAPSDNFTAWAQIYPGTVMCEGCRPIFKDRRFRQRSWVAAGGSVAFSDKESPTMLWDVLCEPPEPPFAIYLTAGGQKQGWISLGRYPSRSRDRYWVGTDWGDKPVYLERSWVLEQSDLLGRMRERKTPKTVLLDGQFSSGAWERSMREGWQADIEAVLARVGDPRWEVVVRAHP